MSTLLNVLCVKDARSDIRPLIEELKRSGFEPTWQQIDTERDFLASLDPPPDLVLADSSLPGFDGFRVLELLRDSKLSLPCILLSREPREEAVQRAVREGASDFVPFEQLGRSVAQVLEQRDRTERIEDANAERPAAITRLVSDVSFAFIDSNNLRGMLQVCCESLVRNLDAAFARIWTLNEADQVLELQASAGLYTHIDGAHSRVPVGKFKIGLIAQEHAAHLTNDVLHDPRVGDREWARREGMISFAGYPLMVENRLVGVMAMFARSRLTNRTIECMGAIANLISIGIERKQSDQQLQLSEIRKALIMESAPDGIVAVDSEGLITDFNPAAARIFGRPQLEFIGTSLDDLLLPFCFDADHPWTRIKRMEMETVNEDFVAERRHVQAFRGDGRSFPIELTIIPCRENGRPRYTCYIRDVTEQRKAERSLQVQYATVRTLAECSTLSEAAPKIIRSICEALGWQLGAIWVVDNEAVVLRCEKVWHREEEGLRHFADVSCLASFGPGIGLPGRVWRDDKPAWIVDVLADPNFPRAPAATRGELHGALAFPVHVEGKVHAVIEFFSREIEPPDIDLLEMLGAVGGQIDQFLLKRITEQRLVKSHQALHVTIEASPLAMLTRDPQGIVQSWNPAAECLFGWKEEEVLGRYIPIIPDGEEQAFQQMVERELRGETQNGSQVRRRRKDGTVIDVSIWTGILRDHDDKIAGTVTTFVDMTERNQLELQLAQARKLESIGQLAAGIAHEINTPIQYVGDNVHFLRDAFKDLQSLVSFHDRLYSDARAGTVSPRTIAEMEELERRIDLPYLSAEIPKAIEQSSEGVQRVAKIVRAMKEFSHPGSEDKKATDLNRAIESTITVSRNEWKYVAEMNTELDPALPPVPCLVGELNQVFLNLIVNAADAIREANTGRETKGSITVTTRIAGDFVEIRIRDSGTGIPEAIRTRIFDPFFTTKQVGKGSGQGLAIARNVVVKKHGGSIRFETEAGKGTTFIIRLPIDGRPVTESPDKAST